LLLVCTHCNPFANRPYGIHDANDRLKFTVHLKITFCYSNHCYLKEVVIPHQNSETNVIWVIQNSLKMVWKIRSC